jgi:DNA-directed RNA polymerase subunit RPC12/RpoP
MNLSLQCPTCHQAILASDRAAGQTITCPKCGQTIIFQVPDVKLVPKKRPQATGQHETVAPTPQMQTSAFDFDGSSENSHKKSSSNRTNSAAAHARTLAVLLLAVTTLGSVAAAFYFFTYRNQVTVIAVQPKNEKKKEKKNDLRKPQEVAELEPKRKAAEAELQPASKKEPEKPKEPSIQDLIEKGRGFCRTRELLLAEATFTKALMACGPSKDDQLLKVEIYLRIFYARLRLSERESYELIRQARTVADEQGQSFNYFDGKLIEVNRDTSALINSGKFP